MRWFKKTGKNISAGVEELVSDIDRQVEGVMNTTDSIIEPIRQSAFRRFPTLFLLLVTFGVSVVIYSFERLIALFPYLDERPWLILTIGVAVLAATGQLYKKLN